jgi:hypothetical protein
MIDFGEFQPFEEAEMIRPSITILRKSKTTTEMRLYKWLVAGHPPENLSEVISSAPTMSTDRLRGDAWELDPDNVVALRMKLASEGTILKTYANGAFRGVTTGLNEVFVIDEKTRESLVQCDPRSAEVIKPFVQGTHLRPWYVENSNDYLIFTRRGISIDKYPAVLSYLEKYRSRLEPKPDDWPASRKWQGRKPGAYKWYEIQDSVDYWSGFEQTKIVWPDICKLPRFSMDSEKRFLGNTAYIIPGEDYYLLGVLSSWATWFYVSKTAQPLRLRGNRWQYRLIAQFMEQVPIPDASPSDREKIAALAKQASELGRTRYDIQVKTQHRLTTTFGETATGESVGKLNQKASAWWEQSPRQLGAALKASFKLPSNPLLSPRVADEWEPYLAEKQAEVARITSALADAEAEINDRVFRLFDLTTDEISLLMREVEH